MLHYKRNNRTLINNNVLLMLFNLTHMYIHCKRPEGHNDKKINVNIYQDSIIKAYLDMTTT